MASRLPSDFTQSAHVESSTVNASLVLPAPAANVAYLITHITARLFTSAVLPGSSTSAVRLKDGATDIFIARLFCSPTVGDVSEIDLDGPWLITPGHTCTLAFDTTAFGSGTIESVVVIQGTVV